MRAALDLVRGSHQARGRAAWRLSVALLLVGATLATGCTYSAVEPGLFPGPEATEAPAPPLDRRPPDPTNPALPVVGEALWTSGEGLQVSTRFAVHAVRRVKGATVLDWSATPLEAPGLSAGDNLPTWVDFGLTREVEGDVNIVLLDVRGGKAYRPLAHRSRRQFNRCLCSPLWVAQLSLRIGETRLFQVSYPPLPESVRFIDVNLVNVPPFRGVPVTPVGQVPTATSPTDLSRFDLPTYPLSTPQAFHHRDQPQLAQTIQIESITAGDGLTSVQWTLESVTDQPSFAILPYGPPISATVPVGLGVVHPGSASGPRLRVAGMGMLTVRWMTVRAQRADVFECLCSNLGLWAASLRSRGGRATVTTNFPGLPPGVRTVDVVLPGAATLTGLAVTPPANAAERSGPPTADLSGSWTYEVSNPPRGWATRDWPTPLPARTQLSQYVRTVEDLVSLPR